MRRPNWYGRLCAFLAIALLLFFALLGYAHSRESPANLAVDTSAEEWTGTRQTAADFGAKTIAIPGVRDMTFRANSTVQEVNIYNPKENDCLIRFHLYCDGIEIWRSGYCSPGNGYYVIELAHPLLDGRYKGNLVYECCRPDGTRLNGADVAFTIIVMKGEGT